MTRAFFHSGPKDGEWVEYGKAGQLQEIIVVPHFEPIAVTDDLSSIPEDIPMLRSWYKLTRWVHDGRYFRWRYDWQGEYPWK